MGASKGSTSRGAMERTARKAARKYPFREKPRQRGDAQGDHKKTEVSGRRECDAHAGEQGQIGGNASRAFWHRYDDRAWNCAFDGGAQSLPRRPGLRISFRSGSMATALRIHAFTSEGLQSQSASEV